MRTFEDIKPGSRLRGLGRQDHHGGIAHQGVADPGRPRTLSDRGAWKSGLSEKFGLSFDILTRDQIEASVTGNPFVEKNRLILRLDMAARSTELKAKLQAAHDWDLVICDEAHRMAASYFGGEVKETQRHKLGTLLGTRTRNFLLMSATPHNGKEADWRGHDAGASTGAAAERSARRLRARLGASPRFACGWRAVRR